MGMKSKNSIFLKLTFVLILTNCINLYSQDTHKYALGRNFYYLTIKDSNLYELNVSGKMSPIFGKYEIRDDSLLLLTFKYKDDKNYFFPEELNLIKKRFCSYLIVDSLLIPKGLSEYEFKPLSRSKLDSNLIERYILSDRHLFDLIDFKEDSTFKYRFGSDAMRTHINGKWHKENGYIYMEFEENPTIKPFLYSAEKLIIYDKFLIGIVIKDDCFNYYYFVKK